MPTNEHLSESIAGVCAESGSSYTCVRDKEGPSHEPWFKSTVVVNDVRYDSLPGFFNRKAAEQSAAEVSLRELLKAGEVNESVYQPIEYAQKMNYAMPVYQCRKNEAPGRLPHFHVRLRSEAFGILELLQKPKKKLRSKLPELLYWLFSQVHRSYLTRQLATLS